MSVLAESIGDGLRLPAEFIEKLAAGASHEYKSYNIPKRSGTGERKINHPSRRLKAIQRWLYVKVIRGFPVHDSATAYHSRGGIFENAARHCESAYLLRLDLQEFFPSIKKRDVVEYLSSTPPGTENWLPRDRDLFGSFVCRFGRLTIGAPSSPSLSNAICFELDTRLFSLGARHGDVVYTRYADDLFFSTKKPDVLFDIPEMVQAELDALRVPEGLYLNIKKTRHSSLATRRVVTGLVITPDQRISPGRSRKRSIRSRLHRYTDLDLAQKRRLAGEMAYVFSIEPTFKNVLIAKFGHPLISDALRSTKRID